MAKDNKQERQVKSNYGTSTTKKAAENYNTTNKKLTDKEQKNVWDY